MPTNNPPDDLDGKRSSPPEMTDDHSTNVHGESDCKGKGHEQQEAQILLEDVLEQAGGMGTYQLVACLLLCPISVLSAESININFVAGEQDHWCYIPELQNLSHSHQKYVAIPTDDNSVYDKCKMYDLEYGSYTLDDFINWDRGSMTNTSGMKDCTDWVYDQSVFINTITSRYNLVCDDNWMVSMVSTLFMAGILVGALVVGYVSDKYGRKTALYAGIVLKVISTMIGAFPLHYSVTLIARFLMGVSNSMAFLPTFVMVMELLTGLWRTIMGVAFSLFFSFGAMLWPGLSYAVRDDVKLQLTVAIPLIALLTYWWLLDESVCWLVQQHKYDEANVIIRKIAKMNGCPLPASFDSRIITVGKKEEEEVGQKNCLALLTSPKMRVRTLVIDFSWFTVSLMYYALSLNTGTLAGDLFLNTLIISAVEIPANLLCIVFLAWRVTGRRLTTSISLLIAGIASFISVYMILEDIGLAHTIFSTVAKGFVTLGFSAIYVYTSEIFPTEVRNIGMGTASVCARISGMAAPYVGGPMGDLWAPLPPIVYGSFSVLAGFLILLLPETRSAPLFKTIDEAERFGRGSNSMPLDQVDVQSAPDSDGIVLKSIASTNAAFTMEL